MHQLLNIVINLLKWPVALASLLFIAPISYRLWKVIEYIANHADNYHYLLTGIAGYIVLWLFWFKQSVMLQWFSTLEHELTHAFFAMLSLNKVTGLNATGNAGGVTEYQGFGNWIISLAPYFVPSLSLIMLLALSIAKPAHYSVLFVVMGVTLAYHFLSTWEETHREQTDLQKTGWAFVWVFLPTANLLMLLVILTALPNDGLSTERSLRFVWQDVLMVWRVVI